MSDSSSLDSESLAEKPDLIIATLSLRFGSSPNSSPLQFGVEPVTVFVGPNNSGKSRILLDLNSFCRSPHGRSWLILSAVDLASLNPIAARQSLAGVHRNLKPGEVLPQGHIAVGALNQTQHVLEDRLLSALQNPREDVAYVVSAYLSYTTTLLQGGNRAQLSAQQPAGDLQSHPQNAFQALFVDHNKREHARSIVLDAIGKHLVIDPTHLGHLRLRLSDVPPVDGQERGLDQNAVKFHAAATPIEQCSEGIRSFVGVVVQLVAGTPRVVLMDEAEAFLHPPLAFKLGLQVARLSQERGICSFVATHSAHFLMGCIQSGTPVNIVRLTYADGNATARVLPAERLTPLMRNPLLRSTGLLNALFYESVVVTEGDTDRAFYQEINERLLRFDPSRGIRNCLFLNAQNKQTVHQIVGPLRELGIPVAGIVDVDIVKDKGSVWPDLLRGAHTPPALKDSFMASRTHVKKLFEASGKNMKRDGGVAVLEGDARRAANDLFDQLASYGVFVVRGGELECWLKQLGATGEKSAWLLKIFDRMGEDPEAQDYVRPEAGDVWDFLAQIKKWLVDPARKGIPD